MSYEPALDFLAGRGVSMNNQRAKLARAHDLRYDTANRSSRRLMAYRMLLAWIMANPDDVKEVERIAESVMSYDGREPERLTALDLVLKNTPAPRFGWAPGGSSAPIKEEP